MGLFTRESASLVSLCVCLDARERAHDAARINSSRTRRARAASLLRHFGSREHTHTHAHLIGNEIGRIRAGRARPHAERGPRRLAGPPLRIVAPPGDLIEFRLICSFEFFLARYRAQAVVAAASAQRLASECHSRHFVYLAAPSATRPSRAALSRWIRPVG